MKILSLIFCMHFLFLIAGYTDAVGVNREIDASEVEKLICSDEELVRLHEVLSNAYLRALNSSRRDEIVVSQNQWIQNEGQQGQRPAQHK